MDGDGPSTSSGQGWTGWVGYVDGIRRLRFQFICAIVGYSPKLIRDGKSGHAKRAHMQRGQGRQFMASSERQDLPERVASVETAIEYLAQAQVDSNARFDRAQADYQCAVRTGWRRRLTASCSQS